MRFPFSFVMLRSPRRPGPGVDPVHGRCEHIPLCLCLASGALCGANHVQGHDVSQQAGLSTEIWGGGEGMFLCSLCEAGGSELTE